MSTSPPSKKSFLFVINYNREDFIKLFDSLDVVPHWLYWHYSEQITDNAKQLPNTIFWHEYKNATQLLKSNQISKVVFFHIENFFEVVLKLTCDQLGIPTVMMDHGFQDYFVRINSVPAGSNTIQLGKPGLFKKIQNRAFLFRSERALPKNTRVRFQEYKQNRSLYNSLKAYDETSDVSFLRPSKFVSFSLINFKYYQRMYRLNEDEVAKQVEFIGFPYFDDFHVQSLKFAGSKKNQILYIDQPFEQDEIHGWTMDLKEKFINDLVHICDENKITLCVKTHPRSQITIWEKHKSIVIVEQAELVSTSMESIALLGYYSTLLIPLISLKNSICVTLDIHPDGEEKLSSFFTELGVAKSITDLTQLESILIQKEAILSAQNENRAHFIENVFYKFDGKSSLRLKKALESNLNDSLDKKSI